MEILGYLSAVLIGVSLGLIGGGGSILTVPVLIFLFNIETGIAIEYSLFVVGISSLFGAFDYFKNKQIDIKVALIFGLPSVLAIYLTKLYLVPIIPKNIVNFGSLVITKDLFLLLVFAVIMIFASYKMIKPVKENKVINNNQQLSVLTKGIMVGVLTGLVGAGGGFMIIPALVNYLKMNMKAAIGTSLLIIALNSLSGFFVSINQYEIDWRFLAIVSIISIFGIFIGAHLSKKMDGKQLKPIFGWFILIMGFFIIFKGIISY